MNKQLPKVLFLANIPSPYRVEFFNALSRDCDLTVLYQLHSSAERDKQWTAQASSTYRQVFLRGQATAVDKAFCPGVTAWLKTGWDAIFISGNTSPTELWAIAWCKLHRVPYCLEADGGFAGSGSGPKEWIKHRAVGNARVYLSTCRGLDQYFLHYGADPERIRRYRFSSLTEKDILPRCLTREEKQAIRQALGIREERMILTVGQFIPRKGIDLLLKAANGMDKNIGIYIIGGAPTEEYLNYARENDLTEVHFVDFQPKEQLRQYYLAADLFVLPTREDIWGLVVNEAMACGLGVVTTNRCNAGLELIRNGENGYLVEVEDVHALREAMTQALDNPEKLGASALETIRPYTIQAMADDHITHILELSQR